MVSKKNRGVKVERGEASEKVVLVRSIVLILLALAVVFSLVTIAIHFAFPDFKVLQAPSNNGVGGGNVVDGAAGGGVQLVIVRD